MDSRRSFLRAIGFSAWTVPLLGALHRGEPAPHFVAHTIEGERLSTESLKGKVVLIEFWATWCKYCKGDEPAIEAVAKDYAGKGLVVIAVDMGEPKRRVQKYLDANPRNVRIVLAQDTTLAAVCEAKSYPLYILIDREGVIAGTQNGAAGEEALRGLLANAGLGGDAATA